MTAASDGVAEFAGRAIALTNLDRILWPEAGFTKARLVEYYTRVAPLILPHIRGRGLTLARYPGGVEGRGFAQTECRGRPEWMATQEVRLTNGTVRRHCVVEDRAGLAWVANQSALELHTFLAPASRPDRPDAVVFDLDPATENAARIMSQVAVRLREMLAEEDLESFVKTSGARGLHVYVPTGGTAGFVRCKSFAREFAARLAAQHPDRITDSLSPRRRGDRLLVDWTRMSERATIVAPYSPRALQRPSVSVPLRWDELDERRPAGLWFEPDDVIERIESVGDPFAPIASMRQTLPPE